MSRVTVGLVLTGGVLLAVPQEALAQVRPMSLHTELRASWTQGRGFGLGVSANPLVHMTYGTGLAPAIGASATGTLVFGEGLDLELLGQAGAGLNGQGCSQPYWYLPVAAVMAQAGIRGGQDGTQTVVGGQLTASPVLRGDATWTLGDAGRRRLAVGAGFPLPVGGSECTVVTVGRPLREASGGIRRAPVWCSGAPSARARSWMEDASDELGAVQAFIELARALEVRGAPGALVRRARNAAREEVLHGIDCLRVAARLHGGTVGARLPAATSRPAPELGVLAAESHADGWVNEGEAAALARARADRSSDPVIRAVQERIAREEAGHAVLGRDIDRWACWLGGQTARRQRAEVLERMAVG